MRSFLIGLIFSLSTFSLAAQQLSAGEACLKGYFPFNIGSKFTTSYYDAKGKVTCYVENEVQDAQSVDYSLEAMVGTSLYSAKDQLIIENVYDVYCNDGKTQMDLTHQLNPMTMSSLMEFNVEVNGDGINYPNLLVLGDTVAAGTMLLKVSNAEREIQKVTITISTGKVTAVNKKITTPAGIFDCLVLEYDLKVERGFTENTKVIQYLATGVGAVRTEQWDMAKKKKVSFSQLTKFKPAVPNPMP